MSFESTVLSSAHMVLKCLFTEFVLTNLIDTAVTLSGENENSLFNVSSKTASAHSEPLRPNTVFIQTDNTDN